MGASPTGDPVLAGPTLSSRGASMFKHLLIATDGSELAQEAVDQGLALALALGAKATAVTVTAPWSTVVAGDMAVGFPVEEYERATAVNADIVLNKVRDAAAAAGVPCDMLHVKDQFPAEGIIEA